MKIKHSKYKNTGILFELLTRQLTSDTIAGNSPKALTILKKYFNTKTELLKEYKIYYTLSTQKYSKDSQASMFIEELLKEHNKLNKGQLRREKYNLIKEIKNNYNIEYFFKAQITNYKVMASIFNLLENQDASSLSIIDSKITLLEHIITKPIVSSKKDPIMEDFETKNKDERLLTYKILLDKFNEKYQNLQNNQKTLLKEYVNSVTNSPSLKSFINQEVLEVKKYLTSVVEKVDDKAIAIKLIETQNMLGIICKDANVSDDHVINLLNYYELVNELKSIHN